MVPELILFSYIPIVEIILDSNWLQYTFSYPWLFSQFFLSFWKGSEWCIFVSYFLKLLMLNISFTLFSSSRSFLQMISLKWLLSLTIIFWLSFSYEKYCWYIMVKFGIWSEIFSVVSYIDFFIMRVYKDIIWKTWPVIWCNSIWF